MNTNDPNNLDTDLTTGETTLTGEQSATPAPPVARAQNKGNLILFSVLGVLVVAVLGAGYMAFGKRKTPVNHTPTALNAPVHSAPVVTPSVNPTATAPASVAAPATPATVPPPVTPPAAAPLVTPDEAQALLGGNPAQPVTATPSALPSNPGLQTPVVPQPAIPASAQPVVPAVLAPSTPSPTSSVLGTPPVASTVAVTSPSSAVTPDVAGLAPGPALNTPATLVPGDVTLEARVTHLEDRLNNIEAGQSRILDLLAARGGANSPAASSGAEASSAAPKKASRHRVRRHVVPTNTIELVKGKPVVSSKSVVVPNRPAASCHLASIVPNRAWTKQPDGTFLTYGVGDTAPNGAIIKAIDPALGIITDKGKLHCAMTD